MTDPSETSREEMARRHDKMLEDMARMGMELASALEERLGRCKTVAELESRARSFELIAQGVRETLALKAELRRHHAASTLAAARRKGPKPSPGEPAASGDVWPDNVRPLRPRTRPH